MTQQQDSGNFLFTSSIKDEIYHPKVCEKGFEWWYFDALSDDEKEAVVIVFFDNFVFSPRYNTAAGSENIFAYQTAAPPETKPCTVPAVAFVYYRNGKPYYRAYNEYAQEEFSADGDFPHCIIGENSFSFEKAPYGTGYTVKLNAKLPKNLNLDAHFEWLSIESDFFGENRLDSHDAHFWNIVAPRSDVTGRITITDSKGKNREVVHFRGTGCHDHSLDNRRTPEIASNRRKGRAHFSDATAVFYRRCEENPANSPTKLCIVRNDELSVYDAAWREEKFLRNKFGLKYPSRLSLSAGSEINLVLKQTEVIDSSFFFLRFLTEAELSFNGGKPHKTVCITEHIEPKLLKYRWLDYLSDMRIGRKDKGAFFS